MKQNWPEVVEPIMCKAGDILLSYQAKQLTRTQKEEHGFVTEADLASEQFLISELSKIMPEASFCAEESGISGSTTSDYSWVIDPLDGTTNFSYGLPYYCISVALTYRDEPQFGMIYQPLLGELFYAQKGMGAFLNGQPITVSAPEDFNKSLIAVGLPYPAQERVNMVGMAQQVAGKAHGIRHFGAIALDLAYVAAGRLDGVMFGGLAWWDVAAGMLLIQEAGGLVSDFQGNQLNPAYRTCIGGGPMVHATVKDIVAPAND